MGGLKDLKITARQGEINVPVFEKAYPSTHSKAEESFNLSQSGFKDGALTLQVRANGLMRFGLPSMTGKQVDQQTHLGFDLASVIHAPIPAANNGKVVFAGDLGIYGQCIIIDHGLGLQTIYGHLSRMSVKAGDTVKKGQIIGNSGATGMAAGDHLHYGVVVGGQEVNPVEWWDASWIKNNVTGKLELVKGTTGK